MASLLKSRSPKYNPSLGGAGFSHSFSGSLFFYAHESAHDNQKSTIYRDLQRVRVPSSAPKPVVIGISFNYGFFLILRAFLALLSLFFDWNITGYFLTVYRVFLLFSAHVAHETAHVCVHFLIIEIVQDLLSGLLLFFVQNVPIDFSYHLIGGMSHQHCCI